MFAFERDLGVRLLITGDQTPRRVLHRCTTPFFFSRVLMRRRGEIVQSDQVLRLHPASSWCQGCLTPVRDELEFDVLFLIQTSEASALYRRDVNKDVVALSRANSAAAAPLS